MATGGEAPKRTLSQADLLKHLDEQLGFLQDSGDAFDRGRDGEAKRLAVTLRVLLHDTAKSHSLLDQLGKKNVKFWDLAIPDVSGNLVAHGGLVAMRVGAHGTGYVAMLDDVPVARQVPFQHWWDAPVFRDPQGTTLSRRDLVLTAANQDGGAHVDPALDERYARFANDNAMGWVDGKTEKPIEGAVRVAIRQIAHEVLRTLVPGYRKMRPKEPLLLASGGAVVRSVQLSPVNVGSRSGRQKVGRNELCPCGSGRKYKRCCGA